MLIYLSDIWIELKYSSITIHQKVEKHKNIFTFNYTVRCIFYNYIEKKEVIIKLDHWCTNSFTNKYI